MTNRVSCLQSFRNSDHGGQKGFVDVHAILGAGLQEQQAMQLQSSRCSSGYLSSMLQIGLVFSENDRRVGTVMSARIPNLQFQLLNFDGYNVSAKFYTIR